MNIFRFHLHRRRDDIGEPYYQTFYLRASDGKQLAFVTTKRTADDADLTATLLGSQFAGKVITGRFCGGYRVDEAGHFRLRHCHGLAISSVEIAILESGGLFNNLIQNRFQFMDKQQVLEDRNLLDNPFSSAHYLPRLHRCKNFHADFCQLPIGREFRIRTFQVAHHKPLLGVDFHVVALLIKKKTRTLILQERLKLYLSTSSNNSRKKFGDFTSPFLWEKRSICCSTEKNHFKLKQREFPRISVVLLLPRERQVLINIYVSMGEN